MSAVWPYLAALIPVVGIGWLFWLVMKHLVEADRSERRAHAQWERESAQRERQSARPESAEGTVPDAAEKDGENHRGASHNSH